MVRTQGVGGRIVVGPRPDDRVGIWLANSLTSVDLESLWRGRLILVAWGLVSALAIFSATLQASRGAYGNALVAGGLIAALAAIPLLLHTAGSLLIAAHCLAGEVFVALTLVNLVSAGNAPAAMMGLTLVPILSLLAPGWVWPGAWAILVCAEILATPYLEPLGLVNRIGVDSVLAQQAIYRVPILFVLFTVIGGFSADRISRDRRRRSDATARQLDSLNLQKEGLEDAMRERQKNLAAVGTLAAGVAHQINNPVGSILVAAQYAQLMRRDPDHEAIARRAFETIEKEARRCGQIVHSLLRISGGERSEKWQEDIHSVVRSAFEAALPYAATCEADLRIKMETDGPTHLLISPIELEQAIVNLIRNGIEACDTKARVVVRTLVDADRVRIEVEDNGRGLPEEDCYRIFEPFYTTRQVYGGTGLGLSVAKGIVEDHGGQIRARSSADGEGMIFVIDLPVGSSDE